MIKTDKKLIYKIPAAVFAVILAGLFVLYGSPADISSVTDVPSNFYADKQNTPEQENKPEQKFPAPETANNLIKVSFKAGESAYGISVEKGTSAYGAMEKLASTTPFKFSSAYYSGLGYFVDGINGVENKDGYYWTLFVNGKYSNLGASDYRLSEGDRIEWRYTNERNN